MPSISPGHSQCVTAVLYPRCAVCELSKAFMPTGRGRNIASKSELIKKSVLLVCMDVVWPSSSGLAYPSASWGSVDTVASCWQECSSCLRARPRHYLPLPLLKTEGSTQCGFFHPVTTPLCPFDPMSLRSQPRRTGSLSL